MTTPNIEELRKLVNDVSHCAMAYAQNQHDKHASRRLSDAEKALISGLQSQAERIKAQDAIDTSMAARITELEGELRNEKFEHSARRAQLAALHGDDELPEPVATMFSGEDQIKFIRYPKRSPLDDRWHDLYTAEQLRQAQALVRAKMVPLEKDAARWGFIRRHWKTVNFRFKKRPNVLSGFTMTVSMDKNGNSATLLEKEIDALLADGITGEPK